jgi:hypothetical protein
MPLFIDNKSYHSKSNTDTICAEILSGALPETPIRSDKIGVNLPSPQTSAVCDEGGMVYIDSSKVQALKNIVTKTAADCICVYMSNGNEHAFVHVSAALPDLDLSELVNKFKDKNNIKVILMGGTKDHARSKANLANIVSALLKVTDELNISLEINSQKLMQYNLFEEKNKVSIVFDKIVEGAIFLSQHYFQKDFNLNLIKEFTTEDFKKPYNGRDKLDPEYITFFAFIMCNARFLMLHETPAHLKDADEMFKLCKEPEFIIFIKAMFSSTGYTAIKPYLDFSSLMKNGPGLYNFAINLNNGQIFEISEFSDDAAEIYRNCLFLDPERPRSYVLQYDTDHYVPLIYSSYFMTTCLSFISRITQNVINKNDIHAFINQLHPNRSANIELNIKKIIKIHNFLCYLKKYHEILSLASKAINLYSHALPVDFFYNSEALDLLAFNNAMQETVTFKPSFSAYSKRGNPSEYVYLMACKNASESDKNMTELTKLGKPVDELIINNQFYLRIKP